MKNWNWVLSKQSWPTGKQFLEFSLQWLRKIKTFKVTYVPPQDMSHVSLESKSVVLLLIWCPLHQTSTVEEKSEQSVHIWTILPHCFSGLEMILTPMWRLLLCFNIIPTDPMSHHIQQSACCKRSVQMLGSVLLLFNYEKSWNKLCDDKPHVQMFSKNCTI